MSKYEDGDPCDHPGCLHHISHPCEVCGRIAGRTKQLAIYHRGKTTINTDPQRRCYNGCHFSSEEIWTKWSLLEFVNESRAAARLEFWQDLNAYAVSQRGKSAKAEYEIREVVE